MATLAVTPEALRLAAATLKHRKANDPWTGPDGAARPEQLPPEGEWQVWAVCAGRGWGKTRTGAEYIRWRVATGQSKRIVLAGPTAADIRDIMIEGESGLLAVCERAGMYVRYLPSKRRVEIGRGKNKAVAVLVSADEPNRFRGLQCDTFWCDELGVWRYPEAWDMLLFGHRLGDDPRGIVTFTPRPTKVVKEMLRDPDTHITRGSTFDNVKNLAAKFINQIKKKYEGTRLGRQEMYAELLEDFEGAFWSLSMIDAARVRLDNFKRPIMPDLEYICVSADPATTFGEKADQTGIAVTGRGTDQDFYVLHAEGVIESPEQWAGRICLLYEQFEANEIVYEGNQGGEMVGTLIKQWWRTNRPGHVMPKIRRLTSRKAKSIRAEPIAMLYEQKRVHHVGTFPDAEDQMAAFPVDETAGDDIVDAVVQGVVACHKKSLAQVR